MAEDSPANNKNTRHRLPRRSLSLRTPTNTVHRSRDAQICNESPDIFDGRPFATTPVVKDNNRLLGECSTPLNTRKRQFFTDDTSPMPFMDSPYQCSPVTMSQEMRRLGVDVAWQWNSPKRSNGLVDRNQRRLSRDSDNTEDDPPPVADVKRRKSFSSRQQYLDRKIVHSNSNRAVAGFNKIREELLKAKDREKQQQQQQPPQQQCPLNVNMGERKNNKSKGDAEGEEVQEQEVTLTRKLSDELLNDSDSDELLLIASQELEKQAMGTTSDKQKGRISMLQDQSMTFTNDSFDQFLTDIPFEELLTRNGACAEAGYKTFNRTLSMPMDTKGTAVAQENGNRSIVRHDSMPPSTTTSTTTATTFGGSDRDVASSNARSSTVTTRSSNRSSSSTESISSSTSSTGRLCSSDEIARKRRIAQERLKSKQSAMVQKQG